MRIQWAAAGTEILSRDVRKGDGSDKKKDKNTRKLEFAGTRKEELGLKVKFGGFVGYCKGSADLARGVSLCHLRDDASCAPRP